MIWTPHPVGTAYSDSAPGLKRNPQPILQGVSEHLRVRSENKEGNSTHPCLVSPNHTGGHWPPWISPPIVDLLSRDTNFCAVWRHELLRTRG